LRTRLDFPVFSVVRNDESCTQRLRGKDP
jgi:hypothetical protein